MVDEIYDRTYRNGREQLHADVDCSLARFGRAVTKAFRTIQAIRFTAVWKKRPKDVGCA